MPGNQPHPQIYEPLSHTGDLGMLVYGHDVPELFAHAAWAMFDLMSDATLIQPRLTRTMGVEGAISKTCWCVGLSELASL